MTNLVIGIILGAIISWCCMIAVLNYLMDWNDRK